MENQVLFAAAYAGNVSDTAITDNAAPRSRRLIIAAWISALSASLLVFSELLAFDYALAWSIGSSLGLTPTVIWTAAAVGAVASAGVTVRFFRIGIANELALVPPAPTPLDTRPIL